jgi:hypothetical protein
MVGVTVADGMTVGIGVLVATLGTKSRFPVMIVVPLKQLAF